MTPSTDIAKETIGSASEKALGRLQLFFAELAAAPAEPLNSATITALLSLVAIWAAWFYGTWATWGSLTIDCGREMYVPLVLSEGKTLYKDIWYLYGPAAPYFNSYLYRLFGAHLNVLYWAGSLSALGSAIFLYLAGLRLSSWLVGWTAGAVVLTQAFHHSLFNFPLPYSFASVYGCLTACVFLWLAIRAANSSSSAWVFCAGTAAAVALLLKLEIGAACYAGLALLIAARWFRERSWKRAAADVAACLPGVVACVAVLFWMISLRGAEFLTQENIMSWPTSFFMRTYGKFWVASTGLSLNANACFKAVRRTVLLFAIFGGFYTLVSWRRATRRGILLGIALLMVAVLAMVAFLMSLGMLKYTAMSVIFENAMRYIFFVQDMVLYIGIVAVFAWWYFWKQPGAGQSAAVALALTFSALFAARILLMTMPMGYPIFYDGPAVLCYLLLARQVIHEAAGSRRSIFTAEAAICALCLTAAFVNRHREVEIPFPATTWLTTDRGSVRVSENLAAQYGAAIQFMKEQSGRGEKFLSVPEDTSLYFLSGTDCPTRVFAFTPGILAPGKMTDELVEQIEKTKVRYLIWSNRTFPEYGVTRFGYDFDQSLGQYFFSHYHRLRPLVEKQVPLGEWNASIWERNAEAKPPGM